MDQNNGNNTRRDLRNQELETLNEFLLREPNNAEAVKKRAIIKYRLNDYKGALEDWSKANEIQPNDAFIIHNKGATKQLLGDYQGSLEDLNRADVIQPNDAFTLRVRGDTKRLLGDYQGSLEDLNRADELRPNSAFTLRARGKTRRKLGDYKGALEDLNRADEIKPNNAFTLQQRAIVRYHLKDFLNAFDDIVQALKLCPNNKKALDWKRKIEAKIEQINITDSIQKALRTEIMMSSQPQNAIQQPNTSAFPVIQKALRTDIIMSSKPQNAIQESNTSALPVIQEGLLRKSKSNLLTLSMTGVIQVPFSEVKMIKTLGEGGFGEVSLAEWNGVEVALKKLKSSVVVDDMSHEAKTLMLFRYKFIVVLMGFTTDPSTNSSVLIMEYMKHGSLEDLLFKQHVKPSRTEVIRLALDIALGVNYLHSHNPKVIHRDLKSANVLLHRNKTRAKIADFGTVKFLRPNVQAKTVFSSLIATPPEMLAEEIYDEKVDVFSFGVILYEMLTNKRLPILEENPRIIRIRETINDGELMQLVLDCCASDPYKRPHMRDVIKLLRTMKSASK